MNFKRVQIHRVFRSKTTNFAMLSMRKTEEMKTVTSSCYSPLAIC